MSYYKDLIKEMKEKGKEDKRTKGMKTAKEQAIFKDLIETEGKCRKCGRTIKLTLDHIIPKEMLKSFGYDIERDILEGNYQLLCKICNQFKSGRLDFSIPETKELLENLLKEI